MPETPLVNPGDEIILHLITPLDDQIQKAHIAHAYGLGLPHLFADEPETLRIIANGPSARQAPLDGVTLALNGALKLFTAKGLAPTYYACCDPQALVAGFLNDAPKATKYLIASKCHPSVFEALKHRDVHLWDIDDHVPGGIPTAPSITLVSLMLAFRMGWRKFEVWGWDGCFSEDGSHHAVHQSLKVDRVTIDIGERSFVSSGSWAAEAKDARTVVSLLEYFGAEIAIKGGGMIDAACRLKVEPEVQEAA